MAKTDAKEIKPLSCKLGFHTFRGYFTLYASQPGDEKQFPLQYKYCIFCSKKVYKEH